MPANVQPGLWAVNRDGDKFKGEVAYPVYMNNPYHVRTIAFASFIEARAAARQILNSMRNFRYMPAGCSELGMSPE